MIRLLFQQERICLICHRAYGLEPRLDWSERLQLCPACLQQIEWIQEPLCPICGRGMEQTKESVCLDCQRRSRTYFVQSRSAVRYNALMKEWLSVYKYRGRERLAEGLAVLLELAYQKHYRSVSMDRITFVPLHEQRLHERKFNQAEQLARHLAQRTGIPAEATLQRIKETPKQSKQRREERLSGLAGAFRYTGGAPGHSLLLVDDIYTTGATVNECAKVLKASGWKNIHVLTVARA